MPPRPKQATANHLGNKYLWLVIIVNQVVSNIDEVGKGVLFAISLPSSYHRPPSRRRALRNNIKYAASSRKDENKPGPCWLHKIHSHIAAQDVGYRSQGLCA